MALGQLDPWIKHEQRPRRGLAQGTRLPVGLTLADDVLRLPQLLASLPPTECPVLMAWLSPRTL